jgi:hypothetical protein
VLSKIVFPWEPLWEKNYGNYRISTLFTTIIMVKIKGSFVAKAFGKDGNLSNHSSLGEAITMR